MHAPARTNPHVTTNPIAAGGGWLSTQFVDRTHLPHPDGNRFGDQYGNTWYPDYGLNADVIFGLAAAHVGDAKLHTALSYLANHVHAYAGIAKAHPHHRAYDGSVAKLALAVIVAGGHPRHFAGYNLLRALHRDECVRASSSGEPCPATGAAANIYSSVSESFVMLAEARGGSGPSAAARTYFASLQCANGGFTSGVTACQSGRADIDSTSYALMALQAIGGPPAAIQRAVQWLRGKQRAGGYWVTQRHPNVDSTGLAAAALAGLHRPLGSARTWLRSQQVATGHRGAGAFRYAGTLTATTKSATSPSVIATAQALTGLVAHGTLAEVSSAGAKQLAPLYPPRAVLPRTHVQPGSHPRIRGIGFAAGEHVRVTLLNGELLGRGSAGPLGVVRTRFQVPSSLHRGRHTVVLHGVASKLAARHTFTVGRSATATATATYAAASFGSAPQPTHVAILIRGKGAACVSWHKGLSGDRVLNEVANVVYRPSDGMIVQIDGTPKSGSADDTHYWSYWHDASGSWKYSNVGASGYYPAAGTVEGWSYDNGQQQAPPPNSAPNGLYESICGAKDRSSAPTPSPTPAPSTSHHAAHPRPAPHHSTAAAHKPTWAGQPSATPLASPTAAHRTQPARAHRLRSHVRADRHTARRARHQPATHSSAVAPATQPVRSSAPRLLAKPTAQPTSSSPVPTFVALGLVAALLAGGALFALRRRRLQ